MKYTLLEVVKSVLSSLDSDEVTSINDTTESAQVVAVAKTCYFDIAEDCELPRDYDTFQLTATSASTPVTMTLPSPVGSLNWLKYNVETLTDTDQQFQFVQPLMLEDFLARVNTFEESDTNVITYSYTNGLSQTLTFMARDDTPPQYYTSFNDGTILFDSYDATVDTYLAADKTLGYGQLKYSWTESDSFTPNLDDKQSQRWLHETKALAWAELKQSMHQKSERKARELRIMDQKTKGKIRLKEPTDDLPNYGRR